MMTIWYLARAAGMVALMAFTASTALGALSADRLRASDREIDRRFLMQMAHRSAAVTGLLALLTHVVLLVVDSFVNLSVGGALLPFTAGYRPLALGLGTLGVYTIVLVAVSGAARGRLASSERAARRWRVVHLAAYVGWVLAMAHGVLAGTDTGALWSTAIYAGCATVVAVAAGMRLRSRAQAGNRPLSLARSLDRSRS